MVCEGLRIADAQSSRGLDSMFRARQAKSGAVIPGEQHRPLSLKAQWHGAVVHISHYASNRIGYYLYIYYSA